MSTPQDSVTAVVQQALAWHAALQKNDGPTAAAALVRLGEVLAPLANAMPLYRDMLGEAEVSPYVEPCARAVREIETLALVADAERLPSIAAILGTVLRAEDKLGAIRGAVTRQKRAVAFAMRAHRVPTGATLDGLENLRRGLTILRRARWALCRKGRNGATS